MINTDVTIDYINKKVSLSSKEKSKTYSVQQLYSIIQDIFDEPENMKYDIPIVAKSKTEYELVNGWSFDNNLLKNLKGGTIETNKQINK